jgi:GNAT superfamily N-acetyltransferase
MPQETLEIVAADDTHFPIIQEIARLTWPDTFNPILSNEQINYMLDWMYSLPSLKSQVNDEGHIFLLAKSGDDYLGFASYETNYQDTPRTKLHKIYILPQAQGKGVGKALIMASVVKALQHRNRTLLLNVNRGNKAVNFYQKMGFVIIAEENIPIGNDYWMEDYVMEKKLSK